MNKQDVLKSIEEVGVVPVVRASSAEEAMQVIEAIRAGGVTVLEITMTVPRAVRVRVRAWDRTGAPLDFEAKGLAAGTFQHEVDHLDGKLFVDRVTDTRSLCTTRTEPWNWWTRAVATDPSRALTAAL